MLTIFHTTDKNVFFEIYDPFKRDQLDKKLHSLLLNRMVMLSYNVEKPADLPYNTLHPFVDWIIQNNTSGFRSVF